MRSSRAILTSVLGVAAIGAGAWWTWRELVPDELQVHGRDAPVARRDEQIEPAPTVAPTRNEVTADLAGNTVFRPAPDEPSTDRRSERKPVLLHVLDRRTREPLRDVEVAGFSGLGFGPIFGTLLGPDFEEAGEEPRFVKGDSPLTVRAELVNCDAARFVVRATGHAAAFVGLDFETGGEREVLLEPACGMRVLVDSPSAGTFQLALFRLEDVQERLARKAAYASDYRRATGHHRSLHRVREQEEAAECVRQRDMKSEASLARLAAAASSSPTPWNREVESGTWAEFASLVPGDWIAVATEQAIPPGGARGSAVARIGAGETAERTIRIRPESDSGHGVTLRGTVVIDPAWSAIDATLSPSRLLLKQLGTHGGLPRELSETVVLEFNPEGNGRFVWKAGPVHPGDYSAMLPKYRFAEEIEVGPESPATVELVVPAPCDVELSVVDARTREDLGSGSAVFAWSGTGDRLAEWGKLRRKNEDDPFRFSAPLGRLHAKYLPGHGSYFQTERAFDLAPGRNELAFEVERRAAIRCRLMDGDARVPWEEPFQLLCARIGDLGFHIGSISIRDEWVFVLSPSGRYRVAVAGIPGFDPSPLVMVDVVAGEIVDVTIPLTRAR